MTTLARLTADLTTSMKARDAFRTNTIRQVIGAVRAAEQAGPSVVELDDEQVQAVLASEVKKRRESAEIYTNAGATDRATTETGEADLIESYLPTALSEADLDEVVAAVIAETGATSMRDMGAVMRAAQSAAASRGRVDGKVLSQRVKAALSAG